MGRISQQINETSLQHAVNWYFSLDNIRAANDRMVAFMDQMELPNIYRREPGTLYTASDGQKFEVRTDSLNANYSFKYFGKGQGISANTFVDERNLLWHSLVFSAAERESAYIIDGADVQRCYQKRYPFYRHPWLQRSHLRRHAFARFFLRAADQKPEKAGALYL